MSGDYQPQDPVLQQIMMDYMLYGNPSQAFGAPTFNPAQFQNMYGMVPLTGDQLDVNRDQANYAQDIADITMDPFFFMQAGGAGLSPDALAPTQSFEVVERPGLQALMQHLGQNDTLEGLIASEIIENGGTAGSAIAKIRQKYEEELASETGVSEETAFIVGQIPTRMTGEFNDVESPDWEFAMEMGRGMETAYREAPGPGQTGAIYNEAGEMVSSGGERVLMYDENGNEQLVEIKESEAPLAQWLRKNGFSSPYDEYTVEDLLGPEWEAGRAAANEAYQLYDAAYRNWVEEQRASADMREADANRYMLPDIGPNIPGREGDQVGGVGGQMLEGTGNFLEMLQAGDQIINGPDGAAAQVSDQINDTVGDYFSGRTGPGRAVADWAPQTSGWNNLADWVSGRGGPGAVLGDYLSGRGGPGAVAEDWIEGRGGPANVVGDWAQGQGGPFSVLEDWFSGRGGPGAVAGDYASGRGGPGAVAGDWISGRGGPGAVLGDWISGDGGPASVVDEFFSPNVQGDFGPNLTAGAQRQRQTQPPRPGIQGMIDFLMQGGSAGIDQDLAPITGRAQTGANASAIPVPDQADSTISSAPINTMSGALIGGRPMGFRSSPSPDGGSNPSLPVSGESRETRQQMQQQNQPSLPVSGEDFTTRLMMQMLGMSLPTSGETSQTRQQMADAARPGSTLPVSGESAETREQMRSQNRPRLGTSGEPRGSRTELTEANQRQQNIARVRARNRARRPPSWDPEGRRELTEQRTRALQASYQQFGADFGRALADAHYLQDSGITPFQQQMMARRMVPAAMGLSGEAGYLPGM